MKVITKNKNFIKGKIISVKLDIPWYIKKRFYKIKLFWKFSKEFYAPWETIDMLLAVNFEILCDFVENGGIESILWEEDPWLSARKEIDSLYHWWKIERKERKEEIDYLLEESSIHFVSWWDTIEEEKYSKEDYMEFCSVESKYGKYLSDLYHKCQKDLDIQETENIIRLAKIRNYLWT